MIFAMGAFDLGNDEQPEVGHQYYDSARIALQQELLGEGSIQLVQGLAIMANYLQRSNKPNAGYVCLGIAIRMAMAIGIHASAHEEELTPLETEIRSRLWWGLVTLEAGCCVTFGRPHSLGVNTLDITPMPLNIDEEDLSVSDIVAPPEVERVTLYTAALVQAHLAKIIFRLQDRISKSSPSPTVEQIKWCGDRFKEEVALFPDHMQPGVEGPFSFALSVQIWRGRDYESVIYRPVLLAAAWGSTRSSQSNAQTVLHIIE
jgi:transcriptional regulatory protein GAL4